MKPVNLLPAEYRRKQPTGERRGGAYALLAGLAVLVGAAALYVSALNQVNDRKSDIADAKRETAEAKGRVGALAPVARFLAIKQTREASVRSLATLRFDWERLVRELAHVTPDGVYLREFDGSLAPASAGGATTDLASAQPVAGVAPTLAPQLAMVGCADSQPNVATMLVRLRRLHGVDEVKLTESKDERVEASGQAGVTDPSSCPTYRFELTVTFEAQQVLATPRHVPASLGGGQ